MKRIRFIYCVWCVVTVFASFVKLPIFLPHIWLPKAHVEAPIAGSTMQAGDIFKLWGHGLIAVLPLFGQANKNLAWLRVRIRLVGVVVVGLMCLRRVDIKALTAYSSVAK